MNWGLFTLGLIPFGCWSTAIWWSMRNRLYFTSSAFALAAFNGLVFTLITAGANVPGWLVTLATLLRVPIVVSLIVAIIYAWNGVRVADTSGWLAERFRWWR